MVCKWCNDTDCDCQERIDCDQVGEDGHTMCGVRACGCPRFIFGPQDERDVPTTQCPCPYQVEWHCLSGYITVANLTYRGFATFDEARDAVLKYKREHLRRRKVPASYDLSVRARWAQGKEEILIIKQDVGD